MNTPENSAAKTGKIMLVGLGPGSNDHLTARARERAVAALVALAHRRARACSKARSMPWARAFSGWASPKGGAASSGKESAVLAMRWARAS